MNAIYRHIENDPLRDQMPAARGLLINAVIGFAIYLVVVCSGTLLVSWWFGL